MRSILCRVPPPRVELGRPRGHQGLSLVRLPVPPKGQFAEETGFEPARGFRLNGLAIRRLRPLGHSSWGDAWSWRESNPRPTRCFKTFSVRSPAVPLSTPVSAPSVISGWSTRGHLALGPHGVAKRVTRYWRRMPHRLGSGEVGRRLTRRGGKRAASCWQL